MANNTYVLGRLVACGVAIAYIVVTHALERRGHHHVVAYLLLAFYASLATAIVWCWGINTPIGLLLFGLVIALAGILLTARHALFAAAMTSLLLVVLQTITFLQWHIPDSSWANSDSNFGDVFAYSAVFGMLALASWLYNREMEYSLNQAHKAEAALRQQKATLKLKVQERTEQLRQAQLEEMQQMYRVAELGQLGVNLLHDLANHLTALTLEIEGLRSKQQTKDIARARQIIRYLGNIVASTRARLHGGTPKQVFNVIQKTDETIAFLRYQAAKENIEIDWQPPGRNWKYRGDPASFSQILTILTNNAIDSYSRPGNYHIRKVALTMQRDGEHLVITISDWGSGIDKKARKNLFKPFQSSKQTGFGLGLYIAKQTVEGQFSGTVTLNPRHDHTQFIIKLPLKNAP